MSTSTQTFRGVEYHLVMGAQNKFYRCLVQGNTTWWNWGRRGTRGQVRELRHYNEQEAEWRYSQQRKIKEERGYYTAFLGGGSCGSGYDAVSSAFESLWRSSSDSHWQDEVDEWVVYQGLLRERTKDVSAEVYFDNALRRVHAIDKKRDLVCVRSRGLFLAELFERNMEEWATPIGVRTYRGCSSRESDTTRVAELIVGLLRVDESPYSPSRGVIHDLDTRLISAARAFARREDQDTASRAPR